MDSEFPGSHHWLCTPSNTFANFHCWTHMSNQEYRVFHLRGYLSLLDIPNTRIFHFLFLYATVRLILDVVQFYRAHNQTPNTVSIYHVLTTYHRTPNTISISTMHSHLCHAMSPCICNARCHCMLYHFTCIMNATWTTQSTPLTSVMDNHITCI